MAYPVDETIKNIDKIWTLMKGCIDENTDKKKKWPYELVNFASYSKMFFKEILRLPDCFFGLVRLPDCVLVNEENFLDYDEIIGLSTRSSYRFTTAIVSGTHRSKEVAQSYYKEFERIVERVHYIYKIDELDFTAEEDDGAEEVAQGFLDNLRRYKAAVEKKQSKGEEE